MSYVVPTEFVELPSRGAFYPEGHPLHNQKTVEIKFMTAKDEDILASTALIKNGLVIDRLLENLLVPEVDPLTLLIGDKNALMVAARISAYGADYGLNIRCPLCVAENKIDYDLRSVSYLEECFDEALLTDNSVVLNTAWPCYELGLPVAKTQVGFKLFTSEDEKRLAAKQDEQTAHVTSMLAAVICHVDGNDDQEVIDQFVAAMPAADSRLLRKLYPKLVPNVELKFDFKCEACHLEKTMEVPLTAEFFWPE
jgi:hypothetical protein